MKTNTTAEILSGPELCSNHQSKVPPPNSICVLEDVTTPSPNAPPHFTPPLSEEQAAAKPPEVPMGRGEEVLAKVGLTLIVLASAYAFYILWMRAY